MQPSTMPMTVRARKVVTLLPGPLRVVPVPAVAPEAAGRIVHPLELAVVDAGDDVTVRWRLVGHVAAPGQKPVGVELVDRLEGIEERRPGDLRTGRPQGLDEHAGRHPSIHGEEV